MATIIRVDESNTPQILESLRVDVIKHVFAFYDLQHDPEHTTMYAAFENKKLRGYILIYTALDWTSVILESDQTSARQLIKYAPEDHFVIHTPPDLSATIKTRFPHSQDYLEDWMTVKTEEAKLIQSNLVHRLSSPQDSLELAKLLTTRNDRPTGDQSKYDEWIRRMPMYGVFLDSELVAYAGSFIQLPQVWMIGGVYTNSTYRNKGYATLATSAITEEALCKAETAALFVRSDNYAAIRAYEKIGYRKIGEKLWVDVGTGLRP
jgi:RimJ/RimL family protein N-acetyltransferase